ncbi:MAG: SUMF1/EgtB/PvdO family nonheme iron enzyme [Polyangiaceae bacterium]|nr:SUMF1/EgtB/PvdO family nonheme iron enzyme [Polyangiaceae bacterium]
MRSRLGCAVVGTVAVLALVSCEELSGLSDLRPKSEDGGGEGGAGGTGGSEGEGGASGGRRGGGEAGSDTGGRATGGLEAGASGAVGTGGSEGEGGARGDTGGQAEAGVQAGASGAAGTGGSEGEGGARGDTGGQAEAGVQAGASGVAGAAGSEGEGGASGGTAGGDTGGRATGGLEPGAGGSAGTAGSTESCTMCGDECVDLESNRDHCGQCGRACTMDQVATRQCEDGLCVSQCRAGWGNCYQPEGSDPDDGCETEILKDPSHCGGCGRACVTGGRVDEVHCVGGVCTSSCKTGSVNLNRPPAPEPDDGCEVVFATNVEHCGAEGRACSSANVAERACDVGVCTSECSEGFANVSRPAAPAEDDGCELDIATNADDCGAPGRACSSTNVATRTCEAGVCTSDCDNGFANVSRPAAPAEDDGCEEVVFATNVEHCGAEGRACSSTNVATRTCEDGVCTSSCAEGHWNIEHPLAPNADDGCEAPSGGPTMVRMPEGYYIDSTEVTQAQYNAWLGTLGSSLPAQPAECSSWNTSVAPTCDWDPAARADYPVVCVDWCDAYAYCQGVGKRLCGNRGGGTNPYSDYADAAESQWYAACSSGGVSEYPYGDGYDSDACNGYDYGADETVEVGTLNGCQAAGGTGYEGVFDLSGNVWEWEDSCDGQTGQSDYCRLRGGSFYLVGSDLWCAFAYGYSRLYRSNDVGFRCCAPQ